MVNFVQIKKPKNIKHVKKNSLLFTPTHKYKKTHSNGQQQNINIIQIRKSNLEPTYQTWNQHIKLETNISNLKPTN